MSIAYADYWMGRREQYALALTPEIESNAYRLIELVNTLLSKAIQAGVRLPLSPITKTHVTSGWRPPAVNAATRGAAVNSKHMTGHAVDVYDPDGDLDEWLMTAEGLSALKQIGLWIEHPSCTKGWAHIQDLPPKSGNRAFYP